MAENCTLPGQSITYDFTARNPVNGYCEYQKIGGIGDIKEPGNFIFCLLSSIFGIIGIVTSGRHIDTLMVYMYGLIFGYGLVESISHVTLWNGFSRIAETILKIQQTLLLAFLYSTMDFPLFDTLKYHVTLTLLLLTAGMYPMVAVVLSSSYTNDWIGWLTYDGIWFIVLVVGYFVWHFRDKQTFPRKGIDIFHLIWYAVICIVIAYICWLVDMFSCSKIVVWFFLHGWWHIFLSLGTYYLTTLISFLKAHTNGYVPIVTTWPCKNRTVALLFFVKWEKVEQSEHIEDTDEPAEEMERTSGVQKILL